MSRIRKIRLSVLRPSQQETYRRALDAIRAMREHRRYSLAHAARESGTSSGTVKRYAGSAMYACRGRYRAKPADRLRRDLVFYDERGQLTLNTHSSLRASEIASYHNAVKAYIVYGDDSALREFEKKTITVNGRAVPFITDRRTLNRLARAGELNFLNIYSHDVGR